MSRRRERARASAVIDKMTSKNVCARPLLKYPGGKSSLADQILSYLPSNAVDGSGRYFEPFVGGAAIFWRLRAMRPWADCVLSDANAELVDCYRAVRDKVEPLIEHLTRMERVYVAHDASGRADFYYAVRDDRIGSAARTIFLNKTGFNGLYRVNKSGAFNVPHGRTASGKPPVICDADNLRACSKALHGVQIGHADFRGPMTGCYGGFEDGRAVARPESGDLVYLDCTYEPEPGKKSFVGYTPGGISDTYQEDVASTFRELAARGVYVVASNSATPKIRELYRGFRQIELARPGGMNSDATKRGKVKELLMLGWERT